uniref:Uncharacterized protein n=1 Tax=Acidianus brierleyi TaxID=41673 RepID=A0A2U9IF91_9CREN
MKEIVLSEDILPNLYDIYKESKFKHPLLNPYQIYARQNIRKIKFLLLKEGYTYFNVRKNRYLKILTAIFPLITSRNYEDEIKDFIRNYKNYFGITKILHVYTRNELDYIKLFNNIEKENYSYVINDDSWKPNKKLIIM